MSEIEEVFKTLSSYKSVKCVIAATYNGNVIRSHMPNDAEAAIGSDKNIAASFTALAAKAKDTIRASDTANELTFIRVRSVKHEIMIAPGGDYYMIVVQEPEERKD